MWKVELFLLLVCLMSYASAVEKNTGKAKVTALKDQKDPKEKRESPTSAPYSYDAPQKQFHSPAVHVQPPQPKHTSVEHYTQQHKVAPLEYVQKQQEVPQQQHEQYHPTSFVAPAQQVENLYNHQIKELEDFSFSYPQYESYNQFPGIFGEYEKIIAIPVKQNLKTMPYYQPAQAYHQYPQQSYQMASYAPSIPAHYSSSFTQSPASLFVPQTLSIPQKQVGKIPDYAQGSKGLSHFSTVSSLQPISSSYTKQPSYDVPSYVFTPTERPFKPSPFLGASVVPSEPYRYETPSKSYLPAKEQYVQVVAPQKEQYHSYGPPKEQYHTYIPSKEQFTSYAPMKEYYQQSSLPKEYYQSSPQLPKEYYQQYAQQAAPIDYQIQYVQYPVGKSYLPPAAPANSYHQQSASYLPPAKIESPKNSYLPPPAAPTKSYLPPAKLEKPKNNYLPPVNNYIPSQQAPSNSFLPPNNPYAAHQQAQSQETYDSSEYYSGGHK